MGDSGKRGIAVPILEASALRVPASASSPELVCDISVHPGDLQVLFSPDRASSTAVADGLLGLAGSGDVRFRGQAWSDLSPSAANRLRGGVGRVLSRGNWMETRSVMENLLLPLRHHTVLPDRHLREMACRLAGSFGLPGLPTLLPHRCSAADLERAACIKAFVGSPDLVILEHPLDFGDAGLLSPLIEAIQGVRRQGGAVVWFTGKRSVSEDPCIPADRRYRMVRNRLLALEASP